jgi:integrase
MKIRFYIEKRRGEDGKLLTSNRPVFMTVAFHGNRLVVPTGIRIDLKWWDHEGQQVRDLCMDAPVINDWLGALKHTAGQAWRAVTGRQDRPCKADFRREFDRLKPEFAGGFFHVLFLFMEEGRARWSDSTYRKVRTFYDQFRYFEQEIGYPVRFDTMNEDFFQQFRDHHRAQGRSAVTILKAVNTLVWFLNWAGDRGYNVYTDYRGFYRLLDRPGTVMSPMKVSLDWDELMRLYEHPIDEPRKERVRDLFCLMCFTGLRFEEVRQLTRDNIGNSSLVVHKRGKADRLVPLNDHAAAILEKYGHRYYRDNLALPPVSAVTVNKYLRLLAEEVGLRREVPDPANHHKRVPLFEVLTAGVGVQTFIMHALRLNIPVEMISAFTGVKSDQRLKSLQQEMAEKEMKKFNQIG